jgi:hypothetical protein
MRSMHKHESGAHLPEANCSANRMRYGLFIHADRDSRVGAPPSGDLFVLRGRELDDVSRRRHS